MSSIKSNATEINLCGKLRHSKRSYHWLFVWLILNALLAASIVKRGWGHGEWKILTSSAAVFGYMFFIDISGKVSWTADRIWWRAWDYFSIKPMRHTVHIHDLAKVVTALHPANWTPGRPFDRILFITPYDSITILPSFYRREELEELLRLIESRQPEAMVDPQVIEFMDGGFSDWWHYR